MEKVVKNKKIPFFVINQIDYCSKPKLGDKSILASFEYEEIKSEQSKTDPKS